MEFFEIDANEQRIYDEYFAVGGFDEEDLMPGFVLFLFNLAFGILGESLYRPIVYDLFIGWFYYSWWFYLFYIMGIMPFGLVFYMRYVKTGKGEGFVLNSFFTMTSRIGDGRDYCPFRDSEKVSRMEVLIDCD